MTLQLSLRWGLAEASTPGDDAEMASLDREQADDEARLARYEDDHDGQEERWHARNPGGARW